MDDELKFAYILSTITAIILLYAPIETGVVLLPCFFVSLVLSVKKIRWAQLVWLGIVGYFVYFSFMDLARVIGAYKIYYIATIPTSGLSFFFGYTSMDMIKTSSNCSGKGLNIVITAYLVLFSIVVLGEIYLYFLMGLEYSDSITIKETANTIVILLTGTFILIVPSMLASYYILKESEHGLKSALVMLVMSSLFFIDPYQERVLESIRRLAFAMEDMRGYKFISLGYCLLYILFVITLLLLFLLLRNIRGKD